MNSTKFQNIVYKNYKEHGRDYLPWRKTKNPYNILISEVMLQQTQAGRVIQKYHDFLKAFPTIQVLAQAPLRTVLTVWQGMRYNRRARYLSDTAKIIVKEHKGKIPQNIYALQKLPGVGPATAAGICIFAFNKPATYIETNVRSVIIHHFFKHKEQVSDVAIAKVLERVIDTNHPRKWYGALLDYGVMLKKQYNPSIKSVHYTKQTSFKGSQRELRGRVIALLTKQPRKTKILQRMLQEPLPRLRRILTALDADNLIILQRGT